MSKDMSAGSYKHDASDRKLDHAADDAKAAQSASTAGPGAGHDPAEIAKHDDSGKDRLFEGRQQHDAAEKNSEKSRLAKDAQEHHHPVGDEAADTGTASETR